MMRRRPASIPERKPVFIGCEGQSEVAYVGVLQALLRDQHLHVHLVAEDLGLGAGDPLSRIKLAVQRLEKLRRTRIVPRERFILLDEDQVENDQRNAAEAQRLASKHEIQIVWQKPCFEALLLRHLPGQDTRLPPSTLLAIRMLEREWPGYCKPMQRVNLAQRIDRDAVRRAARVEPELMALLRCVGLER